MSRGDVCCWWEWEEGVALVGPPYLDARHCFWQITYTIQGGEGDAMDDGDALERRIDTMIRFASLLFCASFLTVIVFIPSSSLPTHTHIRTGRTSSSPP